MSTRNFRFLSGERLLIVLLTAAFLSLSLLAFASGRLRGPKFTPAEMRPANEHAIAVPDNQKTRTRLLESEVVAVTDRGFEPTAIMRPQGEFILMIENPNRQVLNFSLSRESGTRLQQIRASREEPNWNEVQDLPPGRYVLTEQSHPEWICLITITAR
jgi:hypothetical protein